MANLSITRKLGERRALSVKVTYPTGYDLSAATVTFWLDTPFGNARVVGAPATAEDITPVDATPETVWKLTYAFDADDLIEIGTHKGEFEVDFGGGISEFYPIHEDIIEVDVVRHPASTP